MDKWGLEWVNGDDCARISEEWEVVVVMSWLLKLATLDFMR